LAEARLCADVDGASAPLGCAFDPKTFVMNVAVVEPPVTQLIAP
jgi:hypothetical protein